MFTSPEAAKEKSKRFFPIEKHLQLEELKVNHVDAAEALKSFLQMSKTLVILNLSDCGIDGVTMNIIANGISLCSTLTQFHAGRSMISGSGVSALCSALSFEHKPRTMLPNQYPLKLVLFLKCCGLNDEDATKVAQLLQNSTRIAGLDLSHSYMSALGASAIMSAVCCNSPVKTINFSYNNLEGGDTQKLSQAFERALSTSSELEKLLIKYTHLKTYAMRGIALGLVRNSSLTCLKIHDPVINAAVLVDLLNAVASNRTLEELCVNVNDLEVSMFAMVDPICNMLQNNTVLTTLKLGRYHYTDSQCQDLFKICQALKQNFTLTKLTLKYLRKIERWPEAEGATDLEKCALGESDSVNLIRAREKKPYVKIHIKICPRYL